MRRKLISSAWTANTSRCLRKIEKKTLIKRLELLDALEAAGVDNWEGYDEALEILRKNQDGT